MVERAHGVVRVGGVTSAGGDARLRLRERRVRVAEAHANATCGGGPDGFDGSGKFGGNRHHRDVPFRSLPELFEEFRGWIEQVLRRMHAAAYVADEWSFEMHSNRSGP